jgi:hypothetical protein
MGRWRPSLASRENTTGWSALKSIPYWMLFGRRLKNGPMRYVCVVLAAMLLAASPSPAPSPSPSPDPAIRISAARSMLAVEDGRLTGDGAAKLHAAAADAHFVLLGEDHGEREIAQFAAALFSSLVPSGFHTVAVETGPEAATLLRGWLAGPAARTHYAAFERTHGGSIAFFGWDDEFAFLERAVRETGGGLKLWGLDQELMGSSKFLLEGMLAQHPGAASTAMIEALLNEDARDYATASRSGSPGDTFVLQVSPAKLSALKASLERDGNARARQLADGLIATIGIYANCCNEQARKSNRDRALLMKQTLVAYLRSANAMAGPPKIFFKFGGEHLYRGVNPLYNLDLGNYVSETADGLGLQSLHVLALGVSGKQSRFAGIGQPWQAATYTYADIGSFGFLAPFVKQMGTRGWTLYDLRTLRSHLAELGISDPEYQRMLFGYDFLLLIPNTTADPAVDPSVF